MIIKAGIEYAQVLSKIGAETFIDAHRESAPAREIDIYVKKTYDISAIRKELSDPANIYHIIKHEDKIAGFSKMILNRNQPGATVQNISKMDQIYLLNSFQGLRLGAQLLQYNIDLSKSSNQDGMWLVVWIRNDKAITFYKKFGFNVISEADYHLTDSHTNRSNIMLLEYATKQL